MGAEWVAARGSLLLEDEAPGEASARHSGPPARAKVE